MLIKIIGTFFIIFLITSCANIQDFERNTSGSKVTSLVLTGYGKDSYTRGNIGYYLDELEALNANTATFLYSCETNSLSSSNVDCDSSYTPSLESIELAIKMSKARGLKVSVRHYIDVKTKQWRCEWNPTKKEEAFKNISSQLVSFSKLLEKYRVEIYTIGAEYCELTGPEYKDNWVDIIKSIRNTFKGKISYGANWETINGKNEYYRTSFWGELDYIGLDLYSPIPDKIKKDKIFKYQYKIIKKYTSFAKKHKKEIYINEVGFAGSSKGTSEPYEWRNLKPGSQQRQADAYKHTLNALNSFDNIRGVFIWRKLATNKYKMLKYNPNETDYDLWKRKAWYEIKNIFSNM